MRQRLLPLTLSCLVAATLATGCSGNSATPAKASDQLSFGVQMARQNLWSEALFRFQQAARLDPNNPRIYNNLAVAAEATGQFEKALEYYRQALKMDPSNRDLKANYSRFVEFYQSFKPPEAEGEDAQAETEEVAAGTTGGEGR